MYAWCRPLLDLPVANTARERAQHLPAGLTEECLATEAARAKLARWHANGRPDADAADATIVCDCADIRRGVLTVLAAVPQAVRAFVVDHVCIIGVAREAGGWWRTAPRMPAASDEPLSFITIVDRSAYSEQDLFGAIAHEVAHSFLCPPQTVCDARQLDEALARRDGKLYLAAKLGRLDEVSDLEARDERRAANLARSWGFGGFAIDAQMQAEHARAGVRSQAEAASRRVESA